jgi:hypothetical protein
MNSMKMLFVNAIANSLGATKGGDEKDLDNLRGF